MVHYGFICHNAETLLYQRQDKVAAQGASVNPLCELKSIVNWCSFSGMSLVVCPSSSLALFCLTPQHQVSQLVSALYSQSFNYPLDHHFLS